MHDTDYDRWCEKMKWFMSTLAATRLSLEAKREVVKQFISQLDDAEHCVDENVPETAESDSEGLHKASQDPKKQLGGAAEQHVATPLDVDRRLEELVARGQLPRRRPWRARQCIKFLPPHQVLEILGRVGHQCQSAITAGCAVADPWTIVAGQIDAALNLATPDSKSTEHDVECAFLRALGGSELTGFGDDLRRLRALPCRKAVDLIERLVREDKKCWKDRLAAAVAPCEAGLAPVPANRPKLRKPRPPEEVRRQARYGVRSFSRALRRPTPGSRSSSHKDGRIEGSTDGFHRGARKLSTAARHEMLMRPPRSPSRPPLVRAKRPKLS